MRHGHFCEFWPALEPKENEEGAPKLNELEPCCAEEGAPKGEEAAGVDELFDDWAPKPSAELEGAVVVPVPVVVVLLLEAPKLKESGRRFRTVQD